MPAESLLLASSRTVSSLSPRTQLRGGSGHRSHSLMHALVLHCGAEQGRRDCGTGHAACSPEQPPGPSCPGGSAAVALGEKQGPRAAPWRRKKENAPPCPPGSPVCSAPSPRTVEGTQGLVLAAPQNPKKIDCRCSGHHCFVRNDSCPECTQFTVMSLDSSEAWKLGTPGCSPPTFTRPGPGLSGAGELVSPHELL